MISVTLRTLILLAFAFLFITCSKEEHPISTFHPERIRVYQDDSIKWAIGSVAGDGVVLLVYVDNTKNYKFKLIDNVGNEIWTKSFGYTFNPGNIVDFQIIYDVDNTFSIFYAKGLKKINIAGEVVYDNNNFLAPLNTANIYKIILGNNNSYLCLGTVSSRALVSEISRTGVLKFSKLYVINVNGPNTFTSAVKTKTGGYLVAGTFSSRTIGLESAFFLMKLNANGDILSSKKTNMDSCSCQGREFIELSDNRFAFLISPEDFTSKENRSRLYLVNDTASILKLKYLDLAEFNYGPGFSPFIGNGLIKSSSNNIIGVMKSANELAVNFVNTGIIRNYTGPQFDYFYSLDFDGEIVNKTYLNKNYTSYFNSIVNMSNGKALLFGTTMSLGDELKLITIEK